jgi:hypothetical protein
MLASSYPKAASPKRRLSYLLGAWCALLGLSAAPALGAKPPATPLPPAAAPAAVPAPSGSSAALAGCEGQTFSQSFAGQGDSNYYTLVQGGEFNNPSEGWELFNGATIVQSARPSKVIGGVLDLRSGSVAISPPVCVTLQYPAARVWVRDVRGGEGVAVSVVYLSARTATMPQGVGELHGVQGEWALSNPISVQPQIAGATESAREARFVFAGAGRASEYQLSGLWVDPRMR